MGKILFINSSPRKTGNTAKVAAALLEGKDYETLDLTEYKVYAHGQDFEDDQFMEVIEKIREADTVVLGSPLYWHNFNGLMRNLLDRSYVAFRSGEFSGRNLYAILQGAHPQKWMLEGADFTMMRFSTVLGFNYKGLVSSVSEAQAVEVE